MEPLGFPIWLRINHAINLFCIFLLIRSGLQILFDHPKLYWNDDTTPGTEWLHFGRKVMPKDRLWTSMDEAESVSSWVALPGGHHNLGAGRNWHLLIVPLWVVNGVTYVTLLFATGEWRRLIPTDWSILPAAWHALLTYATFQVPSAGEFDPYEPLQQLTYAAIVFLVAPMMILTGLCMSPALIARWPWYPKLFGGRQAARSLHFLGLLAIILYTIVHLVLVVLVRFPTDIGEMVLGVTTADAGLGAGIALSVLGSLVVFHVLATRLTLRYQRRFQRLATTFIEPLMRGLFGRLRSRQAYRMADISPYHRVNGYPPVSEEYGALARDGFADWRLEVGGLVEHPARLSLMHLKALPRQEQIVKHNCIQGWSSVAEWAGVPMRQIIGLCRPLSHARYVVFHSYMQEEYAPESYYETLTLEETLDPQCLLAYEMNWRPLPIAHGAPCRLRAETKLGYKMVKYLRRIEFVASQEEVGAGRAGTERIISFTTAWRRSEYEMSSRCGLARRGSPAPSDAWIQSSC